MKKFVNKINVSGYVFKHDLEKRVTGEASKNPGQEYIRGTLHVATDENAMNIVPVKFTYVTAVTKNGNENATYKTLADIIDSDKTYEKVGLDALRVRIDGSATCNDWVNKQNGEMVSAKEVSGSFCHLDSNPKFDGKAEFTFEMLITSASLKEVEDGDDYMDLRGVVFDFREEIHPINLSVTNPAGISYFESQDVSNANPILTKVWGNIISTTVERKVEVESAWGDPTVNVTTRTLRSWELAGSSEPMEFDDESTITKTELEQRVASREINLDEIRKRFNDRQNGGNAFNSAPAATAPASPTATTNYNF